MQWIRSNIRHGALSALLALGLQLGFSFGHLHLDDLVSTSVDSAHATVDGPATSTAPDSSAPVHDPGGVGDICAVCALIQLASASVLSVAPLMALPTRLRPVRWQIALDFRATLPLRGPFRARAPPLA